MTLKLRIPAVTAQPDPSVESRAVYVEEWIESLPYANPPSLIGNLQNTLHSLNRSPLKPAARAGLLDMYLGPYRFLLEMAESDPRAQTVALAARKRGEAAALSRLAEEYAAGYKRTLADSLGRSTLFGNGEVPRHAAQRATLMLGCSALHAWHAYLPVTQGLWRELEVLYRFASKQGFGDTPGTNSGRRADFRLSVADGYKRVLMVALADPYRLAPGAIWRIAALLAEESRRARLSLLGESVASAGLFAIASNGAARPAYPLAQAKTTPPADTLLLDTNPLIEDLQTRLQRLRTEGGDTGGHGTLLGPLIRAFGVPPRRHSTRRHCAGEVNIIRGLSALHRMLGGNVLASSVTPSAASEGEVEVEVEEDWQETQTDEIGFAYVADPWDLIDRSQGGIGVVRHAALSRLPVVGDLAGLQCIADGEAGWTVGVLRWISVQANDDCRAGVEVLGENARPAIIELGAQHRGHSRMGLLLAGSGGHGMSLLLPSDTFSRGSEVVVRTEHQQWNGHMDQLLDASGQFQRVAFRSNGKFPEEP